MTLNICLIQICDHVHVSKSSITKSLTYSIVISMHNPLLFKAHQLTLQLVKFCCSLLHFCNTAKYSIHNNKLENTILEFLGIPEKDEKV